LFSGHQWRLLDADHIFTWLKCLLWECCTAVHKPSTKVRFGPFAAKVRKGGNRTFAASARPTPRKYESGHSWAYENHSESSLPVFALLFVMVLPTFFNSSILQFFTRPRLRPVHLIFGDIAKLTHKEINERTCFWREVALIGKHDCDVGTRWRVFRQNMDQLT
jgi:hypothetical protein